MKFCSGHRRWVYIVLTGAAIFFGSIISGCNSSDSSNATLNGYTFIPESATLTNRYFSAKAGHVIAFVGHGSFEGSRYVWMFTEGETIQGVATLHETGTVMNAHGESTVQFDSMLAQDIHGNVHVLKNGGELSGVAAGLVPTILLPGSPKVDDRFAPSANYTGAVLSLDETVDSYTGVLHTQFIVNQTGNTKNQYDDYWAPGIGQVKSVWSLADGTTGYWMRVHPDYHTVQADVEACLQPGTLGEDARIAFSRKYDVPLSKMDSFVATAASSGDWWNYVRCALEGYTIAGALAWDYFARQDHWELDGWRRQSCGTWNEYCKRYKDHCGSYWMTWQKGCLQPRCGCNECFSGR